MEFDFGGVAEGVGKVEIRNEKLEIRKQNVEEKMAARSRHYRNKEKRDFSAAQADRFAGAKREEKVGLLRNGSGWGGGLMSELPIGIGTGAAPTPKGRSTY